MMTGRENVESCLARYCRLENDDSDKASRRQILDASQRQSENRIDVQLRQNHLVDSGKNLQSAQLSAQSCSHVIERAGELAEFVAARDRDPMSEILSGEAPRALDQPLQRTHGAANLTDAQQRDHQ